MQASRPSSVTYFRQSYTSGHSNIKYSSALYHPAIGTSKPHSKMMMATKFSLGGEGGITLAVKRVSALHHGVNQMTQYRLYQGRLCFQRVIQFQGTYIIISHAV
jgi:hypothetical protein